MALWRRWLAPAAIGALLTACEMDPGPPTGRTASDSGGSPKTPGGGAAPHGDAAVREGEIVVAGVRFEVPGDWASETPSSNMRVAQYQLPGQDGGASALLYLFFFGAGQGGGTEANVSRWCDQFTQADGRPSREVAKIETLEVSGMKVTTVDVVGSYADPFAPGGPTGPDHRLIAAVVEAPGGSVFIKSLGQRDVLEGWRESIEGFIRSASPK